MKYQVTVNYGIFFDNDYEGNLPETISLTFDCQQKLTATDIEGIVGDLVYSITKHRKGVRTSSYKVVEKKVCQN